MASVGQALREARETQSITVEDVALRLRLMHRQVDAMETDDFESLGQPVFARGFVRNYARLLGLQPEPLLERMGGAPAEHVPVAHVEPLMPTSWLTSPWLMLLLLGVVVVVAVPVLLYLWLNSDAEETRQVQPPAVMEPRPVLMPIVVEPAPAEATPPEVPAEPVPSASPVMPDASAPTAGEAGAPASPSSPEAGSSVHLEFADEAWVEIKDASGRMRHRQLNLAGSSVDVRGQPPFDVLIGNATQVRMTYNGRPIDLKPFIAVTVARFTLEE